jgi:hypothetical protein
MFIVERRSLKLGKCIGSSWAFHAGLPKRAGRLAGFGGFLTMHVPYAPSRKKKVAKAILDHPM